MVYPQYCANPKIKRLQLMHVMRQLLGISLSSTVEKTYNRMILNRIRPELDEHLRTNQNGFRFPTGSQGILNLFLALVYLVKITGKVSEGRRSVRYNLVAEVVPMVS